MIPYKIKNSTYILMPVEDKTRVIEENDCFLVSGTPTTIVNANCCLNGATLTGRQQGTTYLTGISYKAPIVINEKNHLIFFPTHSVRNKSCIWIALHNILFYKKYGNKVLIEFCNNQKIILDISYNIFDNQVLRATRLESALMGRNIPKHM